MNKKRIIRIGLLIIGLALFVIGILNEEFMQVFRKATMICYECIGIG